MTFLVCTHWATRTSTSNMDIEQALSYIDMASLNYRYVELKDVYLK